MQSCCVFSLSHSLELLKGGWIDYRQESLIPGISLKKAFIKRYCPPSKTAKQLKEIRNFKQEEIQIEQLTKEFHAKSASEVPNSLISQCKTVHANDEAPIDNTSSNETTKVYFIMDNEAQVAHEEDDVPTKVLPCQLPLKELNPGSFTLPCTIGRLKFYAMAELGVSVNVVPKSMFEHLKLANLKKTNMLVEMANMTKIERLG
ncbi:hypothetical protein Tco_0059504 [Tanacetum coccineum]